MNFTQILKYFFAFIIISTSSFAQTEEEEFYDYSSEFIWGINKSSNSGIIGGFTFKVGRELKDDVFQTFALDIVNIKHQQENRRPSTSGGFIWGKLNYLYAFKFQYGRDYILFKKAAYQGAQITLSFSAGPTIGIVAPYYIEIGEGGTNTRTTPFEDVAFTQGISPAQIFGPGRLFEGLGDSDIEIGFNAKVGVGFEFGTFKSNVTGFEVGFQIDAFTDEIPLAAFHSNQAVFPAAYINLFYGSRK
ncbi:MAG: hypothetical protein AAF363_11980 [Bacteroidota bacterium]